MNWASARCSRATGPRRNEKRAPDSLTPVSRSRPSGAPTSTWSRGANSKSARRAPAPHLDVGVLVGADRHARVGQVGQRHQQRRSARPGSPRGARPSASARRRCRRPRPSPRWRRRPGPCACRSRATGRCAAPAAPRCGSAASCARASSALKRSTSRNGCGDLRVSRRATTCAQVLAQQGDVEHGEPAPRCGAAAEAWSADCRERAAGSGHLLGACGIDRASTGARRRGAARASQSTRVAQSAQRPHCVATPSSNCRHSRLTRALARRPADLVVGDAAADADDHGSALSATALAGRQSATPICDCR